MSETISTPYEDLLSDVLEHGTRKTDRTGTGTTSVFGRQLRFDLAGALHLHGILDLTDTDVDTLDEVLTPERLTDLLAVLHAQPKIHAQIIVPVDALKTGLPLCPACAQQIHPSTGTGNDANHTRGSTITIA